METFGTIFTCRSLKRKIGYFYRLHWKWVPGCGSRRIRGSFFPGTDSSIHYRHTAFNASCAGIWSGWTSLLVRHGIVSSGVLKAWHGRRNWNEPMPAGTAEGGREDPGL